MHFDFIDLRLFLNVLEAGNITAGATRSHLSLASASARIRAMEASLDSPLLERWRRGVTPTPAGKALAQHARLIMRQVERMQEDLADYARAAHRINASSADIVCVQHEYGIFGGAAGAYLLKLLDLDSSLSARKELAEELDVHAGAHGSAEQNIALHRAVMRRVAENGAGAAAQTLRRRGARSAQAWRAPPPAASV